MWVKAPAMDDRLKALKYRARYRGTREADAMVGGFFDRYHAGWDEADLAWFEALVEADDEDIMAWALGRADPPGALNRPDLVAALRQLDYIAAP
jgi:antitoxin CptB